jgi:hypothetical protein
MSIKAENAFKMALAKRGYAEIKTPYFETHVVIVLDDESRARIPRALRYSCPIFTVDEAELFVGASAEEVRCLCAVRLVFRDCQFVEFPRKNHPV